jgi:hypothetical protein
LAKATVAQMVSISARFPYLSPEAQVGINASVLARHKVDEERGYNWDLSTPSDTQEETRRRAEIRARLAAIDSENLWSRVWVLVDGGYFDNTGLTPTREAIAFIDEQRGKEVTSPSEQRLFTKTRVHVVHISSDPGTLCFALPQGWRERLSPRATRFLQVSQQTVRCAQDISSLEESLSQNPFDSFLAPIESLVNVRVEHSRQAVRELRQNISWSRQGYVLEMRELASELADAYGSLRKERGHSEAEIVQASTARVLEGERRASRDKEEVSRLVGHGISQASADAYFSALSEWQEMLREESREAECHKQFAPVGPPLGWTLNKTNQELMQCMSVRGRIVGGILGQFPEPPDFPRLGKDYSAEHLDSDSSPKELQVSR